jgi:hypothetical protein
MGDVQPFAAGSELELVARVVRDGKHELGKCDPAVFEKGERALGHDPTVGSAVPAGRILRLTTRFVTQRDFDGPILGWAFSLVLGGCAVVFPYAKSVRARENQKESPSVPRSLLLIFPPALVLAVVAAIVWAPAAVAVAAVVVALLISAALTAAWTWRGAVEEASRRPANSC